MSIYVSPDFVEAWKYTPPLIIGHAFSTLGTFVGTPYYVYKDMKGNMYSAASGAILNLMLNAILIPTLGVQGAAIATCISYIIVFIYRMVDTRKYVVLNYKKKEYIAFLGVILFLLVLCYVESKWSYIIMAIIYLWLISFNSKMIKSLFKNVVLKRKNC